MDSVAQRMFNKMKSVLFVCLGNICRSPCAEGVLKHQADKQSFDLHVESCGLGDWHKGQLPDERMRQTALARGIALSSRAQAFKHEFFDKFDLILAADHSVKDELHKWAKIPEHKAKIQLMTKFSKTHQGKEVPDPFYHELAQFEFVMDMIEEACQGLLEHLKNSSR